MTTYNAFPPVLETEVADCYKKRQNRTCRMCHGFRLRKQDDDF